MVCDNIDNWTKNPLDRHLNRHRDYLYLLSSVSRSGRPESAKDQLVKHLVKGGSKPGKSSYWPGSLESTG